MVIFTKNNFLNFDPQKPSKTGYRGPKGIAQYS